MTIVFDQLMNYRFLIIPAGAWLVAQLIKVVIALVQERKLQLSYLAKMGGMPSAHSATVCSLATVIGMVEGFQSPLFALSVFFAIIVMYDAAGVRKTVSIHSGVINNILDELFKDNPEFQQRFREFIGHTRMEIVTGAILGILLAWWWA